MLWLDFKYQEVWMAAKSGQPPDFINKVLLAHNHAPLFTHCVWLLSPMAAPLRNSNRGCKARKA